MSSIHLPRDVTDYILDYLHDDPFTLMQCCLVSRSWIHCSRKHLFGQVSFNSSTLPEKWERAFPNPLNSPAFYTRRLVVNGPRVFAKASGKCDWTQAFSRVVELKMWSSVAPLLPSHILKIVRSLPLLEDLSITGSVRDDSDDACAVSQPSTSPPLTGTFQNLWTRGIGPILRELLALPNGVRFRSIDCTWYIERDLRWIKALVDGCADTLQYVRLHRKIIEASVASPIDFSRATKLKEVALQLESLRDVSTVMALKTLTSDHKDLQQISICVIIDDYYVNGFEEIHRRWMDVDRFLAQLREYTAFDTRVMYIGGEAGEGRHKRVERLFSEMMKRGIIKVEEI